MVFGPRRHRASASSEHFGLARQEAFWKCVPFMTQTKYLTAPLKTDKMPPGVPFIVGNEAAERFSYYGVNGILVIFMTTFLMNAHGQLDVMNEFEANKWYHRFVTAVYGLPLLGAILADATLGKYRTIF